MPGVLRIFYLSGIHNLRYLGCMPKAWKGAETHYDRPANGPTSFTRRCAQGDRLRQGFPRRRGDACSYRGRIECEGTSRLGDTEPTHRACLRRICCEAPKNQAEGL